MLVHSYKEAIKTIQSLDFVSLPLSLGSHWLPWLHVSSAKGDPQILIFVPIQLPTEYLHLKLNVSQTSFSLPLGSVIAVTYLSFSFWFPYFPSLPLSSSLPLFWLWFQAPDYNLADTKPLCCS